MRLGAVLRKYRQARGITLRHMHREIGVPLPTLSRIENGGEPGMQAFMAILKWLLSKDGDGDGRQRR